MSALLIGNIPASQCGYVLLSLGFYATFVPFLLNSAGVTLK